MSFSTNSIITKGFPKSLGRTLFLLVTVWLGEDEMSGTGLDLRAEISFRKLRFCNTTLEAYGRQTLEAALRIDVKTWEIDYNYAELEALPFSGDILYFDKD